MRTARILKLVAIGLGIAGALRAQETGSSPEPSKALPRLVGADRWFGIHLGPRNIGTLHLTVQRQGAGILFRAERSLTLGSTTQDRVEDLVVDSEFALQTYRLHDTQVTEGSSREREASLDASNDGSYVWREGDDPPSVLDHVGPLTMPVEVSYLVLAALEWSPEASLALGLVDDQNRTVVEATARIEGPKAARLRGRETAAVEIAVASSFGGPDAVDVFANYRLLAARGDPLEVAVLGGPVTLAYVLGTEEEARADLPQPPEDPERASLREAGQAVMRYTLRGDTGSLEHLVDFEELGRRMVEYGLEREGFSVPALQTRVLESVRAGAASTPDAEREALVQAAELMLWAYEPIPEGETGSFGPPDGDPLYEAMIFRSTEEGWRLVWWWSLVPRE